MSDLLPPDLVEAAAQGRLVPVLGEDLNAGFPRGLPNCSELLKLLIPGYDGVIDWTNPAFFIPKVADSYEANYGEQALYDLLNKKFSRRDIQPTIEQKLAAKAAGPALVTLGWGHAVENALRAVHPNCSRYVTRADVAYQADDGSPGLIKLLGCIDQKKTIIITGMQLHELFQTDSNGLDVAVMPLLVRHPLLFVGIPLDSPILEGFHGFRQRFKPHIPRSFFVCDRAPTSQKKMWETRGYEIIQTGVVSALRALANARSRSRSAPIPVSPPLPAEPFKFLEFYTAADAPIFFGRALDVTRVAAGVLMNKTTVVIGPSGVGKTSLLLAGLLPELGGSGCNTYVSRTLADPIAEIKRVVGGDLSSPAPLRQHLEQVLRPGSTTVIALDQFEELFLRIGPASRRQFAEAISDCLDSTSHEFRFIFVLRDDFLHRLLELEPPLPHLFSHRFAVRRFDESQAREAVEGPAKLFEIPVECAFLDLLLADLVDNETGEIDPAHLQIVCSHAYHRSSSGAFDLSLYRQLGGAGAILTGYLDEALSSLPAGPQREAARTVLKSMVTDQRTKVAMTAIEITNEAIGRQVDLEPDILRTSLKYLVDCRLIRPIRGTDGYFELAHEKLVERIWEWVEPDDLVFKHMRRMISHVVGDHLSMNLLPSLDQWRQLVDRKELLVLGVAEASVMMTAALQLHEVDDSNYWIDRARTAGVDVWASLTDVLGSFPPIAQHRAVRWASKQDFPDRLALMEKALASPYPALRRQAVRIIRSIDDDGARLLLENHKEAGEFVCIPGGKFPFGIDDSRFPEAGPQHVVYVSTFHIQRFPVTNLEYFRYTQATPGASPPPHWRESRPPAEIEDHPVVQVNWHEASDYARWFSAQHGVRARLPTAAEWEKASAWDPQSQRKRIWSWGDEYDATKGNTRVGGPGHTTPVGQYSPAGGDSPFGVADMSGNTFDWVSDWWKRGYDGNDQSDPKGPSDTGFKAARGGSWAGSAEGAAAVSNKYSLEPMTRNEYVGFRLVLDVADDVAPVSTFSEGEVQ